VDGDLLPLAAVGAVGLMVGRYVRGRDAGSLVGATGRTAGVLVGTAARAVGLAGTVVAVTGAGVSGWANGLARRVSP
jgi:hypothetical protein